MEIKLPTQVAVILNALHTKGFEAYPVGGCVRDSLLGHSPKDWDVTTSAPPSEVKNCFADYHVIETGIKHGTVTVLVDALPVEVTTFRIDGHYSDGRHPDSVSFSTSLKDDLGRRDFTVNAMAYSVESGVIDLYGGQKDLLQRQIRCVGDADRRFQEDGLRILRALRFASVLGFSIEPDTARSILENRALLDRIAKERIQAEFTKLLCGRNAALILRHFREVIARFIPEILPTFDFEQHSPYHNFDIWEHTLHCVDAVDPDPVLRLTMFFHDIGKPNCFTLGDDGIGHFYGHAQFSEKMASTVLERLRYDRKTRTEVTELIRMHDTPLPSDERLMSRCLRRYGELTVRMLLKVQEADAAGKDPDIQANRSYFQNVRQVLQVICVKNKCFTLHDLAIKGEDLIELGIPEGPEIGRVLNTLLDAVLDEKCDNTREALTQYTKESGIL